MACAAIAQKRKLGAAPDECRVEARRGRGHDRSQCRAPRESERAGSDDETEQPNPDECVLHPHDAPLLRCNLNTASGARLGGFVFGLNIRATFASAMALRNPERGGEAVAHNTLSRLTVTASLRLKGGTTLRPRTVRARFQLIRGHYAAFSAARPFSRKG